MRHLASLAIVVCIALTGSTADGAPRHGGHHAKVFKKKKHRAKAAKAVEHRTASSDNDIDEELIEMDDDELVVTDDEPAAHSKKKSKAARKHEAADDETGDSDRVAFVSPEADIEATGEPTDERDEVEDESDEYEDVVEPVKVHKHAARPKDWHVAIGPYVWASSVDAKVSLGSASVGAGIDFFQLTRHTKFGGEMLAEARYRRFSVEGDAMYGVIAVNGARAVGPFMVTLDGEASSLLADGIAGYRVYGGDRTLFAVEARGGLRYQRTAVSGTVAVAGTAVSPPPSVSATYDGVAGGRVIVRPWRRFYFAGGGDVGLVGDSTSTWSAAVDASLCIGSHARLSAGYRTLTTDSAYVSVVMHGPRFALQATF